MCSLFGNFLCLNRVTPNKNKLNDLACQVEPTTSTDVTQCQCESFHDETIYFGQLHRAAVWSAVPQSEWNTCLVRAEDRIEIRKPCIASSGNIYAVVFPQFIDCNRFLGTFDTAMAKKSYMCLIKDSENLRKQITGEPVTLPVTYPWPKNTSPS